MAQQRETLLTGPQMSEIMDRLAREVLVRHPDNGNLLLVGIRQGGEKLARRIKERLDVLLKSDIPCGVVDINLYRDDWTTKSSMPKVGPTSIPVNLGGRNVLLVDDVLFTGRTVRAAMDALMDLGRPGIIELLVMVDRNHRELPIRADYCGLVTDTARENVVDVLFGEDDGDEGVFLVRSEG